MTFGNKTILVTGGTGSIGSEIVRQLLRYKPKAVRVFARHEDRHHLLMQELDAHNGGAVRFIIGDVRDKERLRLAMEGVDVVFHAAALKHIPFCEYNPFEAVRTNIEGTQNVIDVAREFDAAKVVAISTDKIVDPQSVLGASKLMGEKLMLATFYYQGKKRTTFSCVRFGNVLGTRGSMLPTFKKQILERGEVALTSPDMTRFLMTIPQAVSLVLHAAKETKGQEVFVLKMPAVRVGDFADAAVRFYAPRAGKKPGAIKVRCIGRRSGEKEHEALLAEHEREYALETKTHYILTPFERVRGLLYHKRYPGAGPIVPGEKRFLSEHAPRLSMEEIGALIGEAESG